MNQNIANDQQAIDCCNQFAKQYNLDIGHGKVRRTSSRFCLSVEHGDYNGTDLFGVGTDRFIWLAYKPNKTNKIRLVSVNFSNDGLIVFSRDQIPLPQSDQMKNTWARFPYGVNYILQKEGFTIEQGFDGVVVGNIPGGGMSRSASLTLNLILTFLEVNHMDSSKLDSRKIIDMAQAVENIYIGSPCGNLDQTMILLAKENMGTHYNPKNRSVTYVPLGDSCSQRLCLVVLDTGTDRPGLEKSTYAIRRRECEEFVNKLQDKGYALSCLADIQDEDLFQRILSQFSDQHSHLCDRMTYVYQAQKRFNWLLSAWKRGDGVSIGQIFRQDGIDLRDYYKISGPELETMCDIVRTVPGVLGERMLGGGDKGAAGAMVYSESVQLVRDAVKLAYPRSHPDFGEKYAVHVCKSVDGIKLIDNEKRC